MSTSTNNLHVQDDQSVFQTNEQHKDVSKETSRPVQTSTPDKPTNKTPKSCQSVQTVKQTSTDSLCKERNAQTVGIPADRPAAQANSASAFKPIFKSGSCTQMLGLQHQQSERTNNASKIFQKVISSSDQQNQAESLDGNLIKQKSQESAVQHLVSQKDALLDSGGQLSLGKRNISIDSGKYSNEQPHDRLLNSIHALRRLNSQFSDSAEPVRLMTPSSISYSRNLSFLASRIGQTQLGRQSFHNGHELLAGLQPSRLELSGNTGILQQFGSAIKSPGLINQQTSLGLFGQTSLIRNPFTPLGASSRKDLEIQHNRLDNNHSLSSYFREPISLPGRIQALENLQESPEITQKERKGRLNGFTPARMTNTTRLDEQPSRGIGSTTQDSFLKLAFTGVNQQNAYDISPVKAQINNQNNSSLQHLDSKLSFSKAKQHLKREIESLAKAEAVKSQKEFKLIEQKAVLKEDHSLDQQDSGTDANQDDNRQQDFEAKKRSVRISKSGPDRAHIQLVEQESELKQVSYDVAGAKNKHAVFIPGIGIIDDYMASDNLNECVDVLLQKRSKAAFQQHAAALENAKKTKDVCSKQSFTRGQQNVTLPVLVEDFIDQDGQTDEKCADQLKSPLKTVQRSHDNLAVPMQRTCDSSPEGSQRKPASRALQSQKFMPRIVIRHRSKGAKKTQKRIRKDKEQNKILLAEFRNNSQWSKSKITQLQVRLGLKPSQIYKWNWDMQRKLNERQGPASQSVSAPDITMVDDHSDRKVSDWTGELVEAALTDQLGAPATTRDRKEALSNNPDNEEDSEDSLMSEDQVEKEVQSQAAPELGPPEIHCE